MTQIEAGCVGRNHDGHRIVEGPDKWALLLPLAEAAPLRPSAGA